MVAIGRAKRVPLLLSSKLNRQFIPFNFPDPPGGHPPARAQPPLHLPDGHLRLEELCDHLLRVQEGPHRRHTGFVLHTHVLRIHPHQVPGKVGKKCLEYIQNSPQTVYKKNCNFIS